MQIEQINSNFSEDQIISSLTTNCRLVDGSIDWKTVNKIFQQQCVSNLPKKWVKWKYENYIDPTIICPKDFPTSVVEMLVQERQNRQKWNKGLLQKVNELMKSIPDIANKRCSEAQTEKFYKELPAPINAKKVTGKRKKPESDEGACEPTSKRAKKDPSFDIVNTNYVGAGLPSGETTECDTASETSEISVEMFDEVVLLSKGQMSTLMDLFRIHNGNMEKVKSFIDRKMKWQNTSLNNLTFNIKWFQLQEHERSVMNSLLLLVNSNTPASN